MNIINNVYPEFVCFSEVSDTNFLGIQVDHRV